MRLLGISSHINLIHHRWRTRDIEGDQFRQSTSLSKPDAVPPRDRLGASRYAQHLPFQVFCCESGTHVVDPAQSYYRNIFYRAGSDYHNLSRADPVPVRGGDAPCLDSSQAWFCRDLWVDKAREGVGEVDSVNEGGPAGAMFMRRAENIIDVAARDPLMEARDAVVKPGGVGRGQVEPVDADANAGSDYDAMPEQDGDGPNLEPLEPGRLSIPNSVFRPARILVNPRCPTTYAGVSHTQLALDLFGDGDSKEQARSSAERRAKYVLEDWEGAPESFVCQEQR